MVGKNEPPRESWRDFRLTTFPEEPAALPFAPVLYLSGVTLFQAPGCGFSLCGSLVARRPTGDASAGWRSDSLASIQRMFRIKAIFTAVFRQLMLRKCSCFKQNSKNLLCLLFHTGFHFSDDQALKFQLFSPAMYRGSSNGIVQAISPIVLRKRSSAIVKNTPPIASSVRNCGQTIAKSAPRYRIACARLTK